MEQDRILEYLLKNEAARYEADKEKHRTWRHVLIATIVALTIIVCFYMYFVVPVSKTEAVVDGNSHAIIETSIGEGNNIWQ